MSSPDADPLARGDPDSEHGLLGDAVEERAERERGPGVLVAAALLPAARRRSTIG